MDDYNFPQVTQLAIPFFVAAILIELWLVRSGRARGSFETRDTLTSLTMGTGNVVAGLLLGVLSYWALLWLWWYRVFNLGLSVWVFLVAFLLDDLRYYASITASRTGCAGCGPSTSTTIPASTTICRRRCGKAGRACSPSCSCCRGRWCCSDFTRR
jgi:hypothetical protein